MDGRGSAEHQHQMMHAVQRAAWEALKNAEEGCR